MLKRKIAIITGLSIFFCCKLGFTLPLYTELSKKVICVDQHFLGEQFIFFGNKEVSGDVIITVTGPRISKKVIKKRKNKLNMLVNEHVEVFNNIPSFYQIASNEKIDALLPANSISKFGLSLTDTNIKSAHTNKIEYIYESYQTIVEHFKKEKLFIIEPYKGIKMMNDGHLFTVSINLPSSAQEGTYAVDTYVVKNQKIVASSHDTFEVKKIGVSALIKNLLNNHPIFYSIITVMLALFAGLSIKYLTIYVARRNK